MKHANFSGFFAQGMILLRGKTVEFVQSIIFAIRSQWSLSEAIRRGDATLGKSACSIMASAS